MNWIDTNTLIAICACAIGLTQFLFWRYIANNKAYESEKGKNLATKEDARDTSYEQEKGKNFATKDDIGQITKMVESIKSEISVKKQRETEYLYKRNECLIEFLNCLDELEFYKMKIHRISNALDSPDISFQYLCDLEKYILNLSKQYRLLTVYNPIKKNEKLLLDIYNASNDFSNLLYRTVFKFYNMSIRFNYAVNNYKKTGANSAMRLYEEVKKEAENLIGKYNENKEPYKKYRKSVDEYNIYIELFFDAKLHLKTNFQMEKDKAEMGTTTL
ncbi:hypothetical protein [Bacteroides sp.]|uniref:hypothetical protein n=1 Tax=Bacteroides sp. TaxID=29523 RepID=UPI002FC929BD